MLVEFDCGFREAGILRLMVTFTPALELTSPRPSNYFDHVWWVLQHGTRTHTHKRLNSRGLASAAPQRLWRACWSSTSRATVFSFAARPCIWLPFLGFPSLRHCGLDLGNRFGFEEGDVRTTTRHQSPINKAQGTLSGSRSWPWLLRLQATRVLETESLWARASSPEPVPRRTNGVALEAAVRSTCLAEATAIVALAAQRRHPPRRRR